MAGDELPTDWRPDQSWWEAVFAAVDSGDAARFMGFLTADSTFRFGNAPAIVGASAIETAVANFFAAIGASRHVVLTCWSGPSSAACEGTVTYTRRDGGVLSFPFANAFALRGEKITAYRIYIDNAGLFGNPG
jgi:ketosteroid isomerase-like protein